MSKILYSIFFLLIILPVTVYPQNDKKTQNKNNNATNKAPVKVSSDATKTLNVRQTTSQNESNKPEEDYKIISSNSSNVELEFFPAFQPKQTIRYNGQSLDYITFENAVEKGASSFGQPDIRSRYFAVFLPSEDNNSISVIDYDEKDLGGINLAPVPNYRLKNSPKRNIEDVEIIYNKDKNFYGQNKFFPDNIVELSKPGLLRENVIANIKINPYQYNPVTGVLKQYTRIRVRITFGHQPVLLNRPRSIAEIDLMKGAAINSNIGLNWKNPKLNILSKNFVTNPNSVMNSGDWYRIEIKDNGAGSSDGMYKLTKSFLESAGINFTNVDPHTIKMYGNGGELLSPSITDPRPNDLTEISIYITNENSGHFGNNDYILFYGRSVNNWVYNPSTASFYHYLDFYTLSNYYWICINTPNQGKRMQVIQSSNNSNPIVPTSFTEKLFFEPEISNLNSEGNVWLSQQISNGQSIIWNNTLTGLENNSSIVYNIKPASRVLDAYQDYMLIREDNSTMSDYYYQMGTISLGFGDWIWTDSTTFTINSSQKTNGEQSSFKGTFFTTDPGGEGYLDWMEILYKRRLNSVTGDFIRIVSTDSQSTVEYNVSPFSSNQVMVFDATVHDSVKIINPLITTSNNVKFRKTQTTISKYFLIGQNGYMSPAGISQRIPNQNLHGITDGYDFIIISYKDFVPAANRLKAKREGVGPSDPSYLRTLVVDIQQVYNEFSGGVVDPVAIRDFLNYSYQNWQRKPSYVCFLGNGGFDYKSIISQNENFIPPFEFSDPHINQVNGYTTDDFFVQFNGNNSPPFMAHGRVPAMTLDDANGYLDKEDCYENGLNNGYWKNKIIYVADDGWTDGSSDGSQHTDQSEQLATQFTPKTFDQNKIYLIAYPPVITPAGRRKPAVNSDIIKHWNEGCIGLNWVGHGAPDIWAHEYVFEKDVAIAQLNNVCTYPFVTVASCDFSKFDDPVDICGSTLLTISIKKGAIGTLAATRPTYGQLNSTFNNTFWNELYFQTDTLLLQERFGSAVFKTKQIYYQVNDLKFELLCDPTIRSQYPRFHTRVDSISGLSNDTMRALSKIKVYGSIIHPDSSFWSEYNGKIYMKIFDVVKHITMTDEFNNVFNFTLPGGIIYSGTQNIKNGLWSIEFIVPKDLSYQNQNGKLINYFYNSSYDGSSVFNNFIVGGIDPNAAVDTTGPTIKLYLNNSNFRSGDVVNENFTLLADLFDLSGINTTGTIGHKIEAILNNDINNTYDLTPFYNSDTTYQSGHLSYAFTGFSPGRYNLKLKAWDTYNNPSEVSVDFIVSLSSSLQVMNVFNYPNPFKDKTVFTFQHNYSDLVNVKIKIYTVAGRLIKEINQYNITDKFVSINWDGLDQDGDKLSNGIYIYKLTVESGSGSSVVNTGKLAVLK
jgi:hypothetical protein